MNYKEICKKYNLDTLAGADLTKDNLTGANLTGAYLYYANLSGADLSYANLCGAKLKGTKYDKDTIFPEGFNPKEHDMILIE